MEIFYLMFDCICGVLTATSMYYCYYYYCLVWVCLHFLFLMIDS